MPDDDHLRRLVETNRAEIQDSKTLSFSIKALVDTHTTEIDRNKTDISKIDDRLRTISEAAGANTSRDLDQDRRMSDLETRQARSDLDVGNLSLVVNEAVGAAKTLTGAFEGLRGQIDTIRAVEAVEEPAGEGFDAWLTTWRKAATPTNLVLLIVVVTTIGSLLRGEITRSDAAAQLRAVSAEVIEAGQPAAALESE